MAHQLNHSNPLRPAVEILFENGFEGIADALTILMNEAMKFERDDYLQAVPHQRTAQVAAAMPTASTVLLAMGVRQDGKRSLLGVSVSLSEAEVHWRDLLKTLQDRGLHGVKQITSDNADSSGAPEWCRSFPTKHPCCDWSLLPWRKSPKTGRPEQPTSSWRASDRSAAIYRKDVA